MGKAEAPVIFTNNPDGTARRGWGLSKACFPSNCLRRLRCYLWHPGTSETAAEQQPIPTHSSGELCNTATEGAGSAPKAR
jgi:hypothetical protein